MCGIVGCIYINDFNKNKYVDRINEALEIIAERGPDNRKVIEYNNVIFGHNRLSIIDLDSKSNQPMDYEEKYLIVFNGEIYNYKEIKKELTSYGYKFKTDGDTEVLLASYDYWGKSCVKHFNGMWAFAIYDKEKKEIFCSRDRFGIKPFYYYYDKGNFIFASEIKAILKFLDNRKVNYDVLLPFISRGITDFGEMTFFKNIKKLLPSFNLIVNLKNLEIKYHKYYDIKKTNNDFREENIFELLESSIKLRLRSDVKVGTCLSGGLDSSCIAAIASSMYGNNNLEAIHAKSSLKENDESKYAKKVADYLGIKLHIIEPSISDFWNNLDDVIYRQEEPFGSTSIFMQYFVMKKANEIGCKVMLDGQGADELFLGYEHYLTHIYSELKQVNGFNEIDFFNTLKLFRVNKETIVNRAATINNFEKIWDKILNEGNFNKKYVNKNIIKELIKKQDSFNFQKREIMSKSLQALLRYEDKNSMGFSIETRLPYLDYLLVNKVVNIPIDKKFNKGYLKYALRKSIDSKNLLPHDIIWRYNKMGFESPQDDWINKYKKEMISQIEMSTILNNLFEKIDIRRNDFLWKLFNIAKWEEVFNVQA